MKNRKKAVSLSASALIVALTALGAYITFTSTEEGILTVYGSSNLKFFTVDSNLLLGLVCLFDLLMTAAGRTEQSERLRLWLDRLIYIATVAVALTFTVVAAFFGPSIGYSGLYQGANLYFHLIIPVLGMVFLCTLRRNRPIPLWETAAALIPALLYGLYYTATLLIFGVHFPDTDWYGFAAGGVSGSVIMAGGIFLTTWLLALLLRALSGGAKRRAEKTVVR